MVHTCIKFDSHWTYIASTCFTMLPTDQKLKHDDALTWVVGFVSNLVWCSYLVVGSCTKSFKAFGITKHALASQCPFTAFKFLGFYCGCVAKQLVVKFGGDQSYDHMSLQKKFHKQWVKESATLFTKVLSAPTD